LAALSVELNRQNPHPKTLRVVLRLAMEDGLDWRDLYQKALRARQSMPWFKNEPPSLDSVNPEIP